MEVAEHLPSFILLFFSVALPLPINLALLWLGLVLGDHRCLKVRQEEHLGIICCCFNQSKGRIVLPLNCWQSFEWNSWSHTVSLTVSGFFLQEIPVVPVTRTCMSRLVCVFWSWLVVLLQYPKITMQVFTHNNSTGKWKSLTKPKACITISQGFFSRQTWSWFDLYIVNCIYIDINPFKKLV